MKKFLDEDFLLTTETAETLYHRYAAEMPIIDYHCHVNPKEIFEDKRFENLTQLWLYGDHYKWRLMRSNGVDEYYITGDAPDREKFQKFTEVLPKAIGNPMYHWCHLELKRYFGFNGTLSGGSAEEVWQITREALKAEDMSVRGLINKSNVTFIGTTDDPADSLEWHQRLKADPAFKTTVAPSFRPDKALNIDKDGWREYISLLSDAASLQIDSFDTLKAALKRRMEFFNANGCKASDHGLDYAVYRRSNNSQAQAIMQKALSGISVTEEEAESFKTELLLFCAREYSRLGWVMQLHYNCMRNPNKKMLSVLGPDSGFDCIGPNNGSRAVAEILGSLYEEDALPKTVIYSLDANDNAFLDTLIGSFQGSGTAGKIQHGSAWWFNDTKKGMENHLTSLASLSLLGNFIGMLTDSRSFLSYTRHEYFRRILCNLIGEWVENGEYPNDEIALGKIISDICFNNAEKYFGLEVKQMNMKLSFRWYGDDDPISLEYISQIPGMRSVVSAVYDVKPGEVWPLESLAEIKKQCEENGLVFDVVESIPVHEDIKLGRGNVNELLEVYCENIRRCAKYGVKCVTYNFMPVFDWTRTQLDKKADDGSTSLVMYWEQMRGLDPLKDDIHLPGWDSSYSQEQVRELIAAYGKLGEEGLWKNLEKFLKKVIPVAEEHGVRMAIHPDDPPYPIFGLPRIITNEENIDRFLKLVDSPANSLCLCTGSLGCAKSNDIPKMVRKYAEMDRIAFMHIRNVYIMDDGSFEERAHLSDCGSLDIYEIVKALTDNDFSGYVRPDHGRMIWGESGKPGYGLFDRALGAAYINGLFEACEKSQSGVK